MPHNSHLYPSEDPMGVYSVLGPTAVQHGSAVVLIFISRCMSVRKEGNHEKIKYFAVLSSEWEVSFPESVITFAEFTFTAMTSKFKQNSPKETRSAFIRMDQLSLAQCTDSIHTSISIH